MDQTVSFDITPEQEASKLQFLRRQFFGAAPALSKRDFHLGGRTAIVTGANGGIGLECSRQPLDLGLSRLILAVRDGAKGKAARRTLMATKPLEPSQTVEVWKLDYASYESVSAFAQRVKGLKPRLDIAILNAGVNRGSFALNPTTGHEEDLQTSYFSTALLVLLLLRVFKKAQIRSTVNPSESFSPGRIVVLSSDQEAWARFDEKNQEPSLLQALDDEANWDKIGRYSTTKLLGQPFVTELCRLVPPSLAAVNCANSGLCYGSGIGRELGLVTAVFIRVFGQSAALGARTLVHAAVIIGESSHGQYVENGKLRPWVPHPQLPSATFLE